MYQLIFNRYLDGSVVPYFKEKTEEGYEKWGRTFFLSAIKEYCEILPLSIMENNAGYDLRSPAYYLLQSFSEHPLRADAEAFGSLPFEHDQFGSNTFTLAPKVKVNKTAIKEAFIYGKLSKAAAAGQVGAWGAGAWAAREPGIDKFVLIVSAKLGFLRIHHKSEIKRVFSETKHYIKQVFNLNKSLEKP